jgi:hypothetical protein
LLEVCIQGADQPPDSGALDGLVSREALERSGTRRQGSTRGIRRLEEALVARDDVAAQPCLQVDQVLLERVGADELLAGLTPQVGRPAQVRDRQQHECERPAHDHRKETARDGHSASQPRIPFHALWRRR